MELQDQIELRELATIEQNLSVDRDSDSGETDMEATLLSQASGSGFGMASASGFMIASPSGFLVLSPTGFLIA